MTTILEILFLVQYLTCSRTCTSSGDRMNHVRVRVSGHVDLGGSFSLCDLIIPNLRVALPAAIKALWAALGYGDAS